jgi:hypothetical protein
MRSVEEVLVEAIGMSANTIHATLSCDTKGMRNLYRFIVQT